MSATKVGVGISESAESQTAALNAVRQAMEHAGLTRAAWALCFFTTDHLSLADVIHRVVMEESGCLSLAGCTARGVLGDGLEVEGRPGIVVMVGASTAIEAKSRLLGRTTSELGVFSQAPTREKGERLVLAMPDAYRVDNQELVKRLDETLPGTPVFGAGSSDDGNLGMCLQLGMEGVHSGAISMMGLYGDMKVRVGITQSCQPVGQPRFITRAKDYVLVELDGQPALKGFIEQGKELGLGDMQIASQSLMFGFPLDPENPSFKGEDCVVQALAGFDQDTKGLIIPHIMRERQTMGFMHRNPEKARMDVSRMATELAEKLEQDGEKPHFGFYFNCLGRGEGLYGKSGVDLEIIHNILGDFPLAGMFGGFEMATTHDTHLVYTYSGVLVLVTVKD